MTSLTTLEERILAIVFDALGPDVKVDDIADSIMALVKEENEACVKIADFLGSHNGVGIAIRNAIRDRMKDRAP